MCVQQAATEKYKKTRSHKSLPSYKASFSQEIANMTNCHSVMHNIKIKDKTISLRFDQQFNLKRRMRGF